MTPSGTDRRVADELEIRNLVAALAQGADTGTVDDYVALFVEDAVWEMPDNPVVGVAGSKRVGRDDIRAGVVERRAAGLQGPGSGSLHVIATILVLVGPGDEAAGRAYWQFYGDTASTPVLRSMGRYDDTYRRTAAGWQLAHRSIVIG
jgi:3-phenylpropionate/cinnamic acid dioxygenase small subunit